jgi:hypothetical protein
VREDEDLTYPSWLADAFKSVDFIDTHSVILAGLETLALVYVHLTVHS